jgi:hypothetical protein
MVFVPELEKITAEALPALTSWSDLCILVGELPDWLPRIALADSVFREVLILAEESTGSTSVPGGRRALLGTLDRVGFFLDRDPAAKPGHYLLHPAIRRTMLAELEHIDPGVGRTREELVHTGIRTVPAGVGAQLATWAVEGGDGQSLEGLWITYMPGELMTNPRSRSAYVEAPADKRAKWPALSYGAGLCAAFDPRRGSWTSTT